MSDPATADERALARAAAQEVVDDVTANDPQYVIMARATLAALDWLEGRRDRAPATGKVRGADQLGREISDAEDLERAARTPGNRDEFYRLTATWGALSWYRNPQGGGQLPIDVSGLDAARSRPYA